LGDLGGRPCGHAEGTVKLIWYIAKNDGVILFCTDCTRKKREVCLCVYFMLIFSLFVSDIYVTVQFTTTCSAQNLLLWLINISLPIALRVLLFLTFIEDGKHTNYVHYKPYLGCMLENTATVSGWYETFTSFFSDDTWLF
jgi:hypothetical protein